MNRALLDQIVDATLYEGYILYPYRASSKKNLRQRFTFGRVYPEAYSAAQHGRESSVIQTECLVRTYEPTSTLSISVRFLQPMAREIGSLRKPISKLNGVEPEFEIVPELCVSGELYQSWHEAVERKVIVPVIPITGSNEWSDQFRFFASRELEPLRDGESIVGVAIRRQEKVEGKIFVATQPLGNSVFKIRVQLNNQSAFPPEQLTDENALLLRLFASTHIILCVTDAEFISQSDPPANLKAASASCVNTGGWPVLVGDETKGERDTMLSSPIILYDYPKVAPESAGSLFDGTEIDEILTLRILTMTDDEKREMRGVDEQARRLLERTEALPKDGLLKMHGTLRQPDQGTPKSPVQFDDFFGAGTRLDGITIGDVYLKPGDRVRLRPKNRADAIDMIVAGRTAVIEAVEQDLEKRVHLAVVLESDPGKDLGLMRQPGHRFFYGLDEVEPLREAVS